ncbi:hypothetical protein BpHYR1_024745, partial [Brachionus plicatilis]
LAFNKQLVKLLALELLYCLLTRLKALPPFRRILNISASYFSASRPSLKKIFLEKKTSNAVRWQKNSDQERRSL